MNLDEPHPQDLSERQIRRMHEHIHYHEDQGHDPPPDSDTCTRVFHRIQRHMMQQGISDIYRAIGLDLTPSQFGCLFKNWCDMHHREGG